MAISLVAGSMVAKKVQGLRQERPPLAVSDGVASSSVSPPNAAQSVSGFGEIAIAPDSSGNYLTEVEIDGHDIRMVVDTGATYVSLTSEDASDIGISPAPADYRFRTMTANGVGTAAKVHIGALRIGNMEIDDVDAFVMPAGALARSLLGMSALSRLGGVEISDGRLVLKR